jgi:hypothetical protein
MIQCKICHRSFTRLITNTHLRGHQLSLSEYKNTFGDDSTVDPTYRLEKMKPMSDDVKRKISAGVKRYAKGHRGEMSLRAKKAIQTKIKNGQDLAFFSGQSHSEKSRKLISLSKIRK